MDCLRWTALNTRGKICILILRLVFPWIQIQKKQVFIRHYIDSLLLSVLPCRLWPPDVILQQGIKRILALVSKPMLTPTKVKNWAAFVPRLRIKSQHLTLTEPSSAVSPLLLPFLTPRRTSFFTLGLSGNSGLVTSYAELEVSRCNARHTSPRGCHFALTMQRDAGGYESRRHRGKKSDVKIKRWRKSARNNHCCLGANNLIPMPKYAG